MPSRACGTAFFFSGDPSPCHVESRGRGKTSLDISDSDLPWRQASRLQFFHLLRVRFRLLFVSTTQLLNRLRLVYVPTSHQFVYASNSPCSCAPCSVLLSPRLRW